MVLQQHSGRQVSRNASIFALCLMGRLHYWERDPVLCDLVARRPRSWQLAVVMVRRVLATNSQRRRQEVVFALSLSERGVACWCVTGASCAVPVARAALPVPRRQRKA